MTTVTVSLAPGVRVLTGAPAAEAGTLVPLRTTSTSGGYDLGGYPPPLADWVSGLNGDGIDVETLTDDLPLALWPHAYALLERLNGVGALASRITRSVDVAEIGAITTSADSTATASLTTAAVSTTPAAAPADARSVTIAPDRFATRPSWRPADFAAGDLAPSTRLLLHLVDGRWVAEHPGGGVQVKFHDAADVRVLTDCATLSAGELDDFQAAVLAALIDNTLVVLATATVVDDSGDFWEFHDYFFHLRSRPGRHLGRSGGSYRFLGQAEPPPVVKPPMSSERIPLVEGEPLLMPYSDVRVRRRSIRDSAAPLTSRQLGEFLGHVARLRDYATSSHDQVSRRFYPGGGARYELEIYPLVHDVDGLTPGAYHYDPADHVLEHLSDDTPAVRASLAFAGRVATRQSPPPVLLVVTARFGRVAWKYESIAYSLVLKHVGVLYAVMYDAATAMGLSPCALGAGNIDYYAAATHTDPLAEPAVGEFILGGPPDPRPAG